MCICADIIFRLSPFSKGVGKKGGVQPCNKEGKRGRGLHGHLSSGYLTHMPHTQTYQGLYVRSTHFDNIILSLTCNLKLYLFLGLLNFTRERVLHKIYDPFSPSILPIFMSPRRRSPFLPSSFPPNAEEMEAGIEFYILSSFPFPPSSHRTFM